MMKLIRVLLVSVLALGGVALIASPAQAACGDTVAEWVDPLLGSAWSGTVGASSFTAVHTSVLNASVTAVSGLTGTGLGTWAKPHNLGWTASAAGIWFLRFEMSPDACAGGKVTAASGGASDAFGNVSSVVMTRTL